MSRNMLAAAALLFGLAAYPAFAQGQPATTPDHARTLQQNQRAYVAPRPAAPQAAPLAAAAKQRPVAASLPPLTGRPVELADRVR